MKKMSIGDINRKQIFDKYSANLHFLHAQGSLPHIHLPHENTYICPLCIQPFSQDDLNITLANPLSLEDVPPKALGGKANILTCRDCNNRAGQTIDAALQKRMEQMDHQQFVPGAKFHAKLKQNGQITRGEITVGSGGELNVKQSYKHNKKDSLDNFVGGISPVDGNPLLELEFYKKGIDFKLLEVALLKTAYLSCFQKYGYAFILDPIYDQVRDQIRNPQNDIYPTRAWFVGPFKNTEHGVHFVSTYGLECIMSIFPLKSASTRVFAFILPVKNSPIIQQVAGFHASIALNLDTYAQFNRFDQANGYLFDINNINNVLGFIQELKEQ